MAAGSGCSSTRADSDTLWLGTRHDGLLKSTDRGATWKAVRFPATPSATGQGVTLLVAAGRTVYAGWGDSDGTAGKPNLYRTSDGTTWEAVPEQPTGTAARVPIRAAYDRHTRELYVTYANAPGPNGQSDGSVHKLRTTDGKWTEVTPVKPGGATSDGGTDSFGYGGCAVDARHPGTVVVSTNNRWSLVDTLYRTTDGGRTWKSLKDKAVLDVSETPYLTFGADKPKFGWWIQALAVDPYDSQHVVYGTGATLYGTRDLKHWAPQIRGLEEASIRQLISPPAGEAHLISGSGDIGVMYHERLTASPSRGMASNPVFGTATGLALAAAKPSYVVRAGWGDNGNGAHSNDGGKTWAPFTSQPPMAKSAPGPIAANADGSVLLWSFGASDPGYRSADNGATWSEVASFPKGAVPVADPVDPTRFYAFDTTTGTLHASTDSGQTFTSAGHRPELGRHRVPADRGAGPLGRPVAEPEVERAVPLHRRRRDLQQGRQLLGLVHPRLRQGRRGRLLPGGLPGRLHREQHRRVPLRRRGEDLEADQRRPAPVGLDRRGRHRRPPHPRPGLRRHQRTRRAVRGARLMTGRKQPGLSDATRGRLLFGGDYNPEQWPEETWHEDVRLMKDAGVNSVTLGVFSWSKLEPEPGAREFGWLDTLMDLMHENGIGVVLATPDLRAPALDGPAAPRHPAPSPRTAAPSGGAAGSTSRTPAPPTGATPPPSPRTWPPATAATRP